METAENNPSDSLLSQFAVMAREEESPIVRLYLASAAQRIPLAQRWSLLEGLTSHRVDAGDHNLPLMYWYAAEPLAEIDATRALALAMSAGESIPLLREFMLRRIGSADAESSLTVLIEGLDNTEDSKLQLTYLKAIRTALQGQRQVTAPTGWAAVSRILQESHRQERAASGDCARCHVWRFRRHANDANSSDRPPAVRSSRDWSPYNLCWGQTMRDLCRLFNRCSTKRLP